jgi:hypothetical protein
MNYRPLLSTETTSCCCHKKSRPWDLLSRHDWPRLIFSALIALAAAIIVSCTPTVQLKTPKEPITINLNIKLDADVRLRIEEEAKKDVEKKSIF